MLVYRVTFSNNEIVSLKLVVGEYHLQGDRFYYEHAGLLIFALIKAESEDEAFQKGLEIVREVRRKK